jgi:hypothetical protein
MKLRSVQLLGVVTLGMTCTAGCLSIGGKSYTTQRDPETEARLAAVESRLGTLEQVLLRTPVPPAEGAQGTNPSW